jgi:hypothetical protein
LQRVFSRNVRLLRWTRGWGVYPTKKLKISTFERATAGKISIVTSGVRFTMDAAGDSKSLRGAKEKLDAMAREVPLDKPWAAPHAVELMDGAVDGWRCALRRTRGNGSSDGTWVASEISKPIGLCPGLRPVSGASGSRGSAERGNNPAHELSSSNQTQPSPHFSAFKAVSASLFPARWIS